MLRVLVVDDDEILARTIKRMLRGRFEVTTANTARAAIAHLIDSDRRDCGVELVLCDANLRDAHGCDVLHVARTCSAPNTFVMMSGMDHGDFGADAYLAKPFTLTDFIDIVERLMASRPSASSLRQWRHTEPPPPRSRRYSASP
jgi:DNA-binding response OmpR family regulator